LHCRPRRTEPQPQATCTENLLKFGFGHTSRFWGTWVDRHRDELIAILRTHCWGGIGKVNVRLSAKYIYEVFTLSWVAVQCSVCTLQCVHREVNLLTLQPHTRRLQFVASRQTLPAEPVPRQPITAVGVDVAVCTVLVPEPAAGTRRTVDRRPSVMVPVIRREHHPVAVTQRIVTGVTRVPSHLQPVVGWFCQYSERAVLGNVPVVGVATRLQVEPQLEAVVRRQLTEQFVAEPVVASRVVEADFKLRPRTPEEVGPIDVLLDQQRDAAGYKTCHLHQQIAAVPVSCSSDIAVIIFCLFLLLLIEVLKVLWHKAASPPLHSAHPRPETKRHLDLFTYFSTAHCGVLSGMSGHVLSPKIALRMGIWTPSNTWFLRPTRVHKPNGIWIGSAVFAQLTAVRRWRCRGMPFPLKLVPSHGGIWTPI